MSRTDDGSFIEVRATGAPELTLTDIHVLVTETNDLPDSTQVWSGRTADGDAQLRVSVPSA